MKPPLPSSDAFWILSSAYLDAGNATFALTRRRAYVGFAMLPCVFLYFRCIELALKAVLCHHGISEEEITRMLGHRISVLLARVEGFAPLSTFGLSADDRKLLDKYSVEYSEKWFEYPDDVFNDYPTLKELRALANRICVKVRFYEQ